VSFVTCISGHSEIPTAYNLVYIYNDTAHQNMIRTILLLLAACTIFDVTAQNVWNDKRAAVVLTYDDGIDGNLDIVVPALDSSGFKGTFYVIGNAPVISKRMEEWRKAAANGHELGNHTLFHPCNGGRGRGFITDETDLRKYTVDRAVKEIRLTNTLLTAIDGKKTRTFAYPCGETLYIISPSSETLPLRAASTER
jgi:peptidoglycan-N-acetylglucosamine deacetylase